MIDIYELLRRDQDGTAEYVKDVLDSLNILYYIDSYGNIFNIDEENVPLLSAHMDTVRKEADFCIGAFLNESEDDKIFSGGILGGDDKCGVYIILKALEAGRKVNFIFSRDEEIGCKGIKALLKPNYNENKENTDQVRKCLWCLVLDRRGNSDIICKQNDYGSKEFEEALEKISNEGSFGYKGASGLCSDANTIRDFISTANISVGYYNPHSQKEYISKADLQKAYDFTLAVIDNLKEKFEATEEKYYNGYGYGYYGYGYRNSGYGKKNQPYNEYPGYYYDDDDFDGYDYSGYTWQDWKNLDTKKPCKCSFCKISETSSTPLYDIQMPDNSEKKICEYCLEELESEIQKIKFLNFGDEKK